MSVLLGCIADDFTGATDLANTLVKEGMRVVQIIGVPAPGTIPDDVDALVVALKSRSIRAGQAVALSLAALQRLREAGARQILFKYCSTFDSTDDGNIGPVAEALAQALGAGVSVVCPAFPETGRTVYNGHLFVGDRLLHESGMENHPLNPMRDADLVRVLSAQTKTAVGLVPYADVHRGARAIRARLRSLAQAGTRFAVVDATLDEHLREIAVAIADAPLITGGSGIALGLPANFERAGHFERRADAGELPQAGGSAVVLSGSCSKATRTQIRAYCGDHPARRIDVLALARDFDAEVGCVCSWFDGQASAAAPLIYTSDEPQAVAAVQESLGREAAGLLAERAMAAIALHVVERGVRRMVIAGGETAGAVVEALGVDALRIGAQIAPGVPWTVSLGGRPIALALKSGNFGAEDFFAAALGA